MDSTIMPTQKRSLTDTQEKFLDALFGVKRQSEKGRGIGRIFRTFVS